MIRTIKVNPQDNVVIPVEDVPRGSIIAGDLTAIEDIPQGIKIAIRDLPGGAEVIRYGVALGSLKRAIPRGGRITEYDLELPALPALEETDFGGGAADLPVPPVTEFEGFDLPGKPYAGTRNILAILPTVQCVSGVLQAAVERIRRELLPEYPQVDGIVVLNHDYGCGISMDAPGAEIPVRTIRNLLHNPNFGEELFVVGLGCEKLTPEMILEPEENTRENVFIIQDCPGYSLMIDTLMAMARGKLERLNRRRRTRLPLAKLCVGMQCGGSDAFSGVTANPAAGYASDLLVRAGATVLFSEVTEVRDGAHLLLRRCTDRETARKLIREMDWYDAYLAKSGVDRSTNPSPGNKKGGLANILEKAMGSIAKSGTAPIVEVLSPGERPSKRGLIFAATPASDFVCGPLQLAGGMGLQVFMTGRGSPYGLAAAPVIKVSSRSTLKGLWGDLIDINAGTIAEGSRTIEEVGIEMFRQIIDTAGGVYKPWAERHGLHNDISLLDPGPIV